MSHEAINSWVQNAKMEKLGIPKTPRIQADKRVPKSKGNIIMEIAEKIRPWIMKMFESVRDENGMAVQPARVHAISLNVAQDIVNEQKQKKANV